MTLYEYNDLDELEQMETLWEFGIELGKRKDKTYSYTLYSIDDFYVELKRHTKYDVLHGLRTFKTSALLGPYLHSIDISPIIPSF